MRRSLPAGKTGAFRDGVKKKGRAQTAAPESLPRHRRSRILLVWLGEKAQIYLLPDEAGRHSSGRRIMAKGQQRSNREKKKPKADKNKKKPNAPATSVFAAQSNKKMPG